MKEEKKQITEGVEKTKIAVYGSLRHEEYNFRGFSRGLSPYKMGVIKGYKLYSLGAYPFIVKTKDNKDSVVVEVMDVTDVDTGRYIDGMEIGAGYEKVKEKVFCKDGEEIECIIYKYPKGDYSIYTLVDGGDWVGYLGHYEKKEEKKKMSIGPTDSWISTRVTAGARVAFTDNGDIAVTNENDPPVNRMYEDTDRDFVGEIALDDEDQDEEEDERLAF